MIPDEGRTPPTPLDTFLEVFWKDVEAHAVHPLAEYLARFPGADDAITRAYEASFNPGSSARTGGQTELSADRIAHYKIIRQIGRGGQATVYLADDTRLHRQIALKVLDIGPAAHQQAIDRFRREAEITSRLDHPGICPVYEVGQDRGALWIAMRYVEGETLASRIAAEGSDGTESLAVDFDAKCDSSPPPPKSSQTPSMMPSRITATMALFEQAARALHVAHEKGVIHRDVKPGNIMVTKAGDPVILDFGLAQEVEGGDVALTLTGDMTGTPAYMSPEQLTAHRIRLDRRTDVYSLGVTLFECLTLRRPFDAPTREGLYKQILTKDPPRARTLNHKIPPDLEVVLTTALEKDADRRYQTALDLAEELRRVRTHEPIVAKPVGPFVRLGRWAQRNPALATTTGGMFLALMIGLVVALFLLGERDRALTQITTERNEKESARSSLATSVADYDRLGDLSRLQRLQDLARGLWPCEPQKLEYMRAWVEQATPLAARLDSHRATLEALRKTGWPIFPDSKPGESRPSGRPVWAFRSDAEQFKHDTTQRLVEHLMDFADPENGLLSDVRARLEFAESVEHETIAKQQNTWQRAADSIAASPKYHGLRITPQLGLIPIDQDPHSGLWEFVHLQTVAPGADPIPKRGQDGHPVITESMGIVFVLLPSGTFRMGATKTVGPNTDSTGPNMDTEATDDESPVTEVLLDAFFLSKYEMTQGQWLRLVKKNPSQYAAGASAGGKLVDLRNPVESVSWEDCERWLGRLRLALPTEAQWEYGARGGTTTPRWAGIGTVELAKAANLADERFHQSGDSPGLPFEPWTDGYAVHAPVGTFSANPFGLHDVLGNVWEWCRDSYSKYDEAPSPANGLRKGSGSRLRVCRGGSWITGAATARSAYRRVYTGEFRDSFLGVRPARALDR